MNGSGNEGRMSDVYSKKKQIAMAARPSPTGRKLQAEGPQLRDSHKSCF